MTHLAGIRGLIGRVASGLGETVSIQRDEPSGASPQASYSLGSGTMGTSLAGTFDVTAIRAPVDFASLPGRLVGVEVQRWRIERSACDFPPAQGDWLTPEGGASGGQAMLIAHVGHSAAGSAYDVYTKATAGAGGLDSSGEDF